MYQSVLNNWLTALRSGEYKSNPATYFYNNHINIVGSGPGGCALCVLAESNKDLIRQHHHTVSGAVFRTPDFNSGIWISEESSDEILKEFGTTREVLGNIESFYMRLLNARSQEAFDATADYIEAYVTAIPDPVDEAAWPPPTSTATLMSFLKTAPKEEEVPETETAAV